MSATYTLQPVTVTPNTNHATVTRLAGFSVRESAGTPDAAVVNLRHGSATGQVLFALELAGNESAGIDFPGHISAPSGVYVQVVSGTVDGVLFDLE